MPMISKQQVLATLTAATHTRHDQSREDLARVSWLAAGLAGGGA
jgi:hypothetical protein